MDLMAAGVSIERAAAWGPVEPARTSREPSWRASTACCNPPRPS